MPYKNQSINHLNNWQSARCLTPSGGCPLGGDCVSPHMGIVHSCAHVLTHIINSGSTTLRAFVLELEKPLGWEAKCLHEPKEVQLPSFKHARIPWPGWLRHLVNIINLQLSSHFSPHFLPCHCVSLSLSGLHPLQNSYCLGQRGDRLLLLEDDCLHRDRDWEWIPNSDWVLTITFILMSTLYTTQTYFFLCSSLFSKWREKALPGCVLSNTICNLRRCVTPFTTDWSIWEVSNLTSS